MLKALGNAWSVPELRRKLLFTFGIIALYRLSVQQPEHLRSGNHAVHHGLDRDAIDDGRHSEVAGARQRGRDGSAEDYAVHPLLYSRAGGHPVAGDGVVLPQWECVPRGSHRGDGNRPVSHLADAYDGHDANHVAWGAYLPARSR